MSADERHVALATRTLWRVVVGLLAIYLLLFALSAASRLMRPAEELVYGESWLLDGARRVARGEGLYLPPDQLPLMHIAYTPLYYVVVGGLQRLVGDDSYTPGRLVSLAATLAGSAALAWSIARLTKRLSFGLLASGLFLTQNLTALLWAPLHRADALALGLTLCGLGLAAAGRLSIAAGVLLLALLTKQTFFVAPLAVLIALWPCRREMLRFGAIVIGGAVASTILAQRLTDGWFLWHTVIGNGNEPDLLTFSALLGSFLQFNGLPVIAALASFTLPSLPGERLWRAYFLLSLATLPSLAKLGASSNYWLELSAATGALLSVGSCKLASWPSARLVAPTIVAGALFVPVPAYQATATDLGPSLMELVRPPFPRYLSLVGDGDHTAAPIRIDSRFVDAIAREPGDLLTDNSGLAVAARKRIAFEFQIFQLLKAEGHWSEQPILDAVAGQRFSLVALMHPLDGPVGGTRWTPGLVTALRGAYVSAGQQAGFWLYRPRSRPMAAPWSDG